MPQPEAVSEALAGAIRRLETAKVPEARANAEWILAAVLKCGRGDLAVRRGSLTVRQGHHLNELLKERCRRIQLAYILGTQNFLGLEIAVNEGVLIPRPETEELVLEAERILKSLGRADPRVLEIGTGSGCVSVALAARNPGVMVHATDISPAALDLAMKNAVAHHVGNRVRFLREDLFKPDAKAPRWADLVISNPLHPSAEIDKLEPEVLKEPRLALDGGKDACRPSRPSWARSPATSARAGGWSWKSAPTRERPSWVFWRKRGWRSGPCARTCRGGTASSPEK